MTTSRGTAVPVFSLTSKIFCLVGCILLSCFAAAQEAPPNKPVRPKVGLVLEGGGALGLAHIGVLQWFEEHHIPINYVAGTSMGGLVGGVYATGRSSSEVHALIKTIPWDTVLQGQTPYEDLSFRRKEDATQYPNQLEFGLRKGLQFPEGFNSGMDVGLILDRVALPYSEMQSFNDLPTPFACVTTDLISAKKYVFHSGSLSLALRSTMSLPGVFSPVRWDGHVFVDGGMVDNLPVDVAKQMGADLIVSVYLQAAELNDKTSLSSIGVLNRAVSVSIAANELRSIEDTDILISVPLQKYSILGFNDADAIIKKGYDAAQGKAAVLLPLAVDDATWQNYLAQRASRRRTVPVPEFVKVEGTNPTLEHAISKDLADNVGKPVDTAILQDQLMDIKGNGRFANLGYQLTDQSGQPGLLIRAEEKPYAPPTVRPLLLLDGSNFNGVYFSLGARITFLDFGSYRAELRNDVIVGSQYGFNTQYYRPFSATSNWFVAPDIFASSDQYPIFDGNTWIAQYRKRRAGGGGDVGYQFGRTMQLSFGYQAAYESFSPEIGNRVVLPTVSGRYGASQAIFILDQVDNPVIPRSGQYGNFLNEWVDANPGASHGFPESEGRIIKFIRVNRPSSIYVGATGGTTFGNNEVGIPPFALGGNNQFAAYGDNELLSDQYYSFQLGYLRQLVELPPLLGDKIYFNLLLEGGKVFGPFIHPQTPGDVAGSVIVNTIFGPVSVGGAIGNSGHSRVFFKLGRIF